MSTAAHDAVLQYIAAWNATDPDERAHLVEGAFASAATYVDPLVDVAGPEQIAQVIGMVHERFPDHRFALVDGPDLHHDRLRFRWALTGPDGTPVARGLDVATLGEDGRLTAVVGFEEPVGAAVPARGAGAYAVANLTQVDVGPEIAAYLDGIDATLAPFGGAFLVHGARADVREGELLGDLVVIAFPDADAARGWYDSPAYRAILPLRTQHAEGWVALVEGVEAGHLAPEVLG